MFGLKFYEKDIKELLVDLERKINLGDKASVFTPNVDHIINNFRDTNVQTTYGKSEYIIADGWPLVLVSKLKKQPIHRITGVDLMDGLLEIADKNKYNLYFLGAENTTLERVNKNIKKKYPNIGEIRGHHGYFKDDSKVIDDINKNGTNILFVGMGNPKQEIWIRNNFEKLNCNLMLGVGGAFKIFSKEVDRAPHWIQMIGMEWFYRFLKEPRRLFSRYFIKYPKFIKILYREIRC